MHARLVKMMAAGLDSEHRRIAAVAADFRERVRPFPFRIASESLSNAVTPLEPRSGVSAHGIFEILKNEYNLYVCPNGGELKDRLFRVGHIGCLTKEDNGVLIEALADMQKRGLL
jgi:aspartate aminotransferase-like enzyme